MVNIDVSVQPDNGPKALAAAIAAMSERRFVERYVRSRENGSEPGESRRHARRRYADAVDASRRAELLVANLRAASRLAATPAFDKVDDGLIEFQLDLPDYEELFGTVANGACEECRSIIGPAAYLFDLMNLAQSRITDPSKKTIPRGLRLFDRRPDLATIPLDCEHTNTEVPYLEIANDIMANKIGLAYSPHLMSGPDAIAAGLAHIATAEYPFDLPFNSPLARVRSYLDDFDVNLAEIYEAFQVGDTSQAESPYPVSCEMLGLSPEAAALIFEPNESDAGLTAAYGRQIGHRLQHALLNFDGRTTFVRVAGQDDCNFSHDQDFSVAAWIKVAAEQTLDRPRSKRTGAAFVNIIALESDDHQGYSFAIRCLEGGIIEASRYDGTNRPFVMSGNLADNDYHHVVFSRSDSHLHLHVDGRQVSKAKDTMATDAPRGGDLCIGAHLGTSSFFRGTVGSLRLSTGRFSPGSNHEVTTSGQTLVGFWPLDEGTGNSVRTGLASGVGALVNGVVSWDTSLRNIATFMDVAGATPSELNQLGALHQSLFLTGAVDFDGYTTSASFDDLDKLDLDGDFTLEFWVKPSENQTDELRARTPIITKSLSGNEPFPFELWYDHEAGEVVAMRSNGKRPPVSLSVRIESGVYQHVAFVRDRGALTLYVNDEHTSRGDNPTVTANDAPILLATNSSQSDRFTGSLARVRVWDYALSAGQIKKVRFDRMTGAEAGLAACWPLDDGGNSIRDLVVPSMPGKLVFRSSLLFDGETVGVDLGGEADYDFARRKKFVVGAWVRHEGGGTVLSKAVDGGPSSYLLRVAADGTVSFSRTTTAGSDPTVASTDAGAAPFGEWTHIAGVYDGSNVAVYRNGHRLQSKPSGPQDATPLVAFRVGAQASMVDGELTDFFQGNVADVMVFTGFTSPSEFMFKKPKPSASRLIGWWPLDEAVGATVKNLAENGPRSGSIVGEFRWLSPTTAWLPGRIADLTLSSLDRMHRFLRLCSRLGWTPNDLAWMMTAIGQDDPTSLTYAAAPGLAKAILLAKRHEMDPAALSGLWADLKTTDDTGATTIDSEFDRIFNTPVVFTNPDHVPAPSPYHPHSTGGNPFYRDKPIVWEPFVGDDTDLAVRNRLLAALEIDNDDLERILNHMQLVETGSLVYGPDERLVLQSADTGQAATQAEPGDLIRLVAGAGAGQVRTVESVNASGAILVDSAWAEAPDQSTTYKVLRRPLRLSVPELSALYRYVAVPRALGLKIDEYLAALPMLDSARSGVDSAAVEQLAQLAELVTSLQESGLTMSQALYITQRTRTEELDVGFSSEAFPAFLQTLATASKPWLLNQSAFSQPTLPKKRVPDLWANLVSSGMTTDSGVIMNAPKTAMAINGATFAGPSDGVRIDRFDSHFGTETGWDTGAVELWLKCGQQSATHVVAAYGATAKAPSFSIGVGPLADSLPNRGLTIAFGDGSYFVEADLEDKLWHHIAVTWNAEVDSLEVFIDGRSPDTPLEPVVFELPPLAATGRWLLGGGWKGDGKPNAKLAFNGSLATVRVWAESLDVKAIRRTMFKERITKAPTPISSWLVEPVRGDKVLDSSGSNGGRLVGNPTCGPMPMFTATRNGRIQDPNKLAGVFQGTKNTKLTLPQIRSMVDLVCSTVAQNLQLQVNGTLQSLTDLFSTTPGVLLQALTIAARNIREGPPLTPIQMLLLNEDGEGERALLEEVGAVTFFATTLSLTVDELRFLVANPACFGLTNQPATGPVVIDLQGLLAIAAFKQLMAAFDDQSNQLLSYLSLPATRGAISAKQRAALEKLTTWDAVSIRQLVDYLNLSETSWNSIADVELLRRCFRLSDTLGMNIDSTAALANLSRLSVLEKPPETGAAWSSYMDAEQALFAAVRATSTASDWATKYAPIRGALNEHERDVLANFMLWHLGQEFAGVTTMQDLYEFLLVDVNMSGVMQISQVKEALNAVQLYIYRCRSNLEVGAISDISDTWWSWMSSYRVWQANREVFLYPENYLDPTLRKDATPPFRQLEQTLLGSDVTDDTAASAYSTYFDELNAVANLSIAGACEASVINPADGVADSVVWYVGRTNSDPALFYSRTATMDAVSGQVAAWTPWQPIDIKTTAQTITPVYAFNRWLLFWVDQTSKTVGDSTDTKQTIHTASIKYTFQQASGAWAAPQTLLADQLIAIDGFVTTVVPAAGGSGPVPKMDPTLPCWNEVTCQHIPASGPGRNEGVLVTFGEVLKYAFPGQYVTPVAKPKPFSGPNLTIWTLLNRAVTRANDVDSATSTGWVPIIEPILLADDLTATPVPWVLLDPIEQQSPLLVPNLFEYGVADPLYSELRYVARQISPLLSCAQLAAFSPDVPSGPAAFWPIIEGSGTIAVSHVVGVANGGILPTTPDPGWFLATDFPGCDARWVLRFSGGTQSEGTDATTVTVPESSTLPLPDPNMPFTVEFWFKIDEVGLENQLLIDTVPHDGSMGDCYRPFRFSVNPQCQVVAARGTSEKGPAGWAELTSAPVTVGEYHHVAFVAQAEPGGTGALWLYVDGELQQAQPVPDVPGTPVDYALVLGGPPPFTTWIPFVGVIADLRIWDVPVSPAILDAALPSTATQLIGNRIGWSVATDSDGTFSVLPSQGAPSLSQGLAVAPIPSGPSGADAPSGISFTAGLPPFPTGLRLESLTSRASRAFGGEVLVTGPAGVLTLQSQFSPERSFRDLAPSPVWVTQYPADVMDFDGAYGEYFWEVFFHLPFLIADALAANQQFADAKRWYEFIFDPIQQPVASNDWLTHDWPIDAGYGTQVDDAAGSDVGTISAPGGWTQAPEFPGGPRNALAFSEDRNVELDSSAVGSAPFTVAAWANVAQVTAAHDGKGDLLSSDIYSQSDDTVNVILSARGPAGNVSVNTWWPVGAGVIAGAELSAPSPPIGEWHHYTATVSEASVTLYIDGIVVASAAVARREILTLPGSSGTIIGQSMNGQIANVRVWNESLSATDVFGEFDRRYSPTNRFWRLRPLQNCTLQTVTAMLSTVAALRAYEDDPFDPYAIARLRIGAFEKTIVMHYLDNLLAWGDNLFTQFSWETIVEASMIYTLAGDLLGPEPVQTALTKAPASRDFLSLEDAPPMSTSSSAQLLELVPLHDGVTLSPLPFAHLRPYFCVPENAHLASYWVTVADRLFKIRHGENIDGKAETLALFQPPIDPAALVQAIGSGAGLAAGLGALDAPMPFHRFSYLILRAKELAQGVVQLGDALSAALERSDAEQLAALTETQAAATLNLTTAVRQMEVDQLNQTVAGLQTSLEAAQARQDTYQAWIAQGLLPQEMANLSNMGSAFDAQITASVLKAIAIPVYLVPNIFGLADGGMQFGQSLDAGAGLSEVLAATLNQSAQLAQTTGANARRVEEWNVELQNAVHEVASVQAQIAAMQTQVEIATANFDLNQTALRQVVAVQTFLQNKFTNQQLFQWTANRISTVYFEGYKLALSLTKAAERAFQYEKSTTQELVTTTAWDSLRKGLAAGPVLLGSIRQLEETYRTADERRLHIEKTISLKQLQPQAFFDLKDGKVASFALDERLFDEDFPGHYDRKITTMSLSIPLVVGPYENIHATLTQTANAVLMQPDPNAILVLLNTNGVPQGPALPSIRTNWNANQQIALSKGADDSGLFELNFHDDRYLPFEGTGAISQWTLEMPKETNRFDFESLSDVIIKLRYTALSDRSIGNAVKDALKSFSSNVVLSMRQSFPSAWHALKSQSDSGTMATIELDIPKSYFPGVSPELSSKKNKLPPPSTHTFEGTGTARLSKAGTSWKLDTRWTISVATSTLSELKDIAIVIPYELKTWT